MTQTIVPHPTHPGKVWHFFSFISIPSPQLLVWRQYYQVEMLLDCSVYDGEGDTACVLITQ